MVTLRAVAAQSSDCADHVQEHVHTIEPQRDSQSVDHNFSREPEWSCGKRYDAQENVHDQDGAERADIIGEPNTAQRHVDDVNICATKTSRRGINICTSADS